MITGLREFRKKLANYTSSVRKGSLVIITDHNEPIASYISIEKLRELANKSKDVAIIDQLKEAQADENRDFIKRRDSFISELRFHLKMINAAGDKIPRSVLDKLQSVLYATQNLLGNEGSFEDQRLLMMLRRKANDPISRVLEYDYYYVHSDFLNAVKNEIEKLTEQNLNKNSVAVSNDLKQLLEMIDSAVLRPKNNLDSVTFGEYFSVLVQIKKDNDYYSSRIYTVMPYWYIAEQEEKYFLEGDDSLARKFRGRKVGDKILHGKFEYEIISIT